jgi:putative sigma-54 modulation protein
MEIRVQSIHFDASEKLQAFIDKKVGKLAKSCDQAATAEVTLKVVKPETALNKEVQVRIVLPGGALHAEKTSDTFEEAIDQCVEVLQRQAEKYKDKQRAKQA